METEILNNKIDLLFVDRKTKTYIYKSDLEKDIKAISNRDNIDLDNCKLGTWKYILTEVGLKRFKGTNLLKEDSKGVGGVYKYDFNKLNAMCDYYLYISNKFNKIVSVEGFCFLCGIDDSYFVEWVRSSNLCQRIYKKLINTRYKSIQDKALDNNNVTGAIWVGNSENGLNMNGDARRTLSADDLQTLDVNSFPSLPDQK